MGADPARHVRRAQVGERGALLRLPASGQKDDRVALAGGVRGHVDHVRAGNSSPFTKLALLAGLRAQLLKIS